MPKFKFPTQKEDQEVIEHGNIQLTNNVLYFKGRIYQIANITYSYVSKFDKDPLPWKLFITLMTIGIIALAGFGLGLLIIIPTCIWFHKKYKEQKEDWFGLYFQLLLTGERSIRLIIQAI